MDYQAHMFKFSPILADTFVMSVVATELCDLMNKIQEEISRGKFKTLDLMHHFTSGLKSLYSGMTYENIETIRVNCGGAGYSVWSFLPQLFMNYSPVPIYEGDNTVMAQQSFSFIQKQLKRIAKNKPAKGDFEYLNHLKQLC